MFSTQSLQTMFSTQSLQTMFSTQSLQTKAPRMTVYRRRVPEVRGMLTLGGAVRVPRRLAFRSAEGHCGIAELMGIKLTAAGAITSVVFI